MTGLFAGATDEDARLLADDLLVTGKAITRDGKRIDPFDFYVHPEEDDDVVDTIPLAAKVYLAVGVLIVIGCIIEALR